MTKFVGRCLSLLRKKEGSGGCGSLNHALKYSFQTWCQAGALHEDKCPSRAAFCSDSLLSGSGGINTFVARYRKEYQTTDGVRKLGDQLNNLQIALFDALSGLFGYKEIAKKYGHEAIKACKACIMPLSLQPPHTNAS
ncbi:hypothetical protein TRV_03334 [Trichophyton verrucosum HKI 0517]|uniref:Uncharacterized protein n=1 Tax=Trichophyton verrucosum (strain HKI 0517) TaxID=663202 RepID=D4D898_TRIVH|nr:uncharacterized protein TRV_03334 [Trichophyton verrucosum HKI 0517]EFE41917.1 hypothetical protein TRV_03334 [Trichophyton verrucosum HKI 0517]